MNTETNDKVKKAYNYAILLLSYRSRTEQELIHRLTNKRHDELVAEQVVQILKDELLVNDELYAKNLVENEAGYGTHGFYYLQQKMRQRQFKEEQIAESLELYFSIDTELDTAVRVFKKFENVKAKNEYELKQKLAGRLRSRGFRSDVISKVVFESN